MEKKLFLLIFALCTTFFAKTSSASEHLETQLKSSDSLIWNIEKKNTKKILWELHKYQNPLAAQMSFKNYTYDYDINAIGRAVRVNGQNYPAISNYVPNGFVEDSSKSLTLSSRLISKIRYCNGKNFSSKCSDAILDLDFNMINNEAFSLSPKFTIQSLTNRNADRGATKIGEASSIGIKAAKKLTSNWSAAIGGENIIHLDEKSDLGRNFYIISSTYIPLNKKDQPSILFLNAGIGSDFYGYKGNGFLGNINCFGTPNLTGNGNDYCSVGPIGSIALAFNSRFSIISEWFGYGYGSGLSFRPFKEKAIDFSLFATDYIKGFPKYIEDGCPRKNCSTRFYGNVSITF